MSPWGALLLLGPWALLPNSMPPARYQGRERW